MKLSTRYIVLSALALLLMISCKSMPESERLIPNEIETTNGRTVLVENYSGVVCINYPTATGRITKTAKAHGDKVVVVVLHGSRTDIGIQPEEDPKGLYGPEVATYLERLQADGSLSIATFNRRPLTSNSDKPFSDSYPQWPAEMQSCLKLPQLYKINLQVSKSDRRVMTRCTATALTPANQGAAIELYLQLWLIEDGTVAPQHLMGRTEADANYQHNYIFRQTLNGPDREAYQLGQSYDKTSTTEREAIVPDHCFVVAILYDHKTGEAYGVAKAPLKGHATH